ncbi:MAG TPA: hypothetical protein P5511_08080, partial [Candidatus Goldiibacteriota bacterium]|nr:hypothetical protein [Candidatus Goldiibacteriota bacterium]
DLKDEKPLMSAIGVKEQIDIYPGRVIIRGRGLSNSLDIRADLKPSEIKSILIKPAGTLYDGNITINARGIKFMVAFKAYSQPDFEQVKVLLAK